MATTISLNTDVRDRLRGYCAAGMSYSDAITRLMDLVEANRFFASFRAALEDPEYPWIDEADFEWA